jgi:hypothetical protein
MYTISGHTKEPHMEALKIKGDETLLEKIKKTVVYLKSLEAKPPFSFSFYHEHTKYIVFANETVADVKTRLNHSF